MARPATAECPVCHYRHPKPEMHERVEITKQRSGGSKTYHYSAKSSRYGSKTRVSERPIKYRSKEKTVFICNDCVEEYDIKKKKEFKNSIIYFVLFALVFFVIIVSNNTH